MTEFHTHFQLATKGLAWERAKYRNAVYDALRRSGVGTVYAAQYLSILDAYFMNAEPVEECAKKIEELILDYVANN